MSIHTLYQHRDIRRSSEEKGKPKTAVGALVARKSRTNRAGGEGGGRRRISKSYGRKSLIKNLMGQESVAGSNTRGNMSTLPSWSNGSNEFPIRPRMTEVMKKAKRRSSYIDAGISVVRSEDDSNGPTSGQRFNQISPAVDDRNKCQSLKPPRRNKQEEYNTQKDRETNNTTFPRVTRIAIGNAYQRKKHVKKQKNNSDDTNINGLMTDDFPTSYALLDDSRSQTPPCHINTGSEDDEDGSSSSSKLISHSFNELLKQRRQGNMNNNDKDESDKNGQHYISSSSNPLPSRSLNEWNDYEKYKEEQDRKMSSPPPYGCVEDGEDAEEGRLTYSSRHALFEPYDSLMGGTDMFNNKSISSCDFSPVKNDIYVGGFCIRDEITSCVSDISYNTGMQSVDYQFSHEPPRYVDVDTQNSAYSGPSTHPRLSTIEVTGYNIERMNGVASCPSVRMDAPFRRQRQKQFGQSANATTKTCNST